MASPTRNTIKPISRRMADNTAGALWMLAGAFVLSVQGAIVRHLSDDGVALVVILFVRTLLVMALVLPMTMGTSGIPNLRTNFLGTHFVRAVFGLSMMAANFYAITVLTLSDAIALSFTRPIWSMLTAYMLLGEVVGWVGGAATLMGFGGVLIIVQPQTGIEFGVIVALAGAAASSVSLVLVKRLTRTEPVERILFYFAFFCCLIMSVPAFFYWETPNTGQWLWLIALAAVGAIGQYMCARAVKVGDMAVVTPVDFTRVPFSALLGYVLFAEQPGIWTFVGTAVILAATLIIIRTRRSPG